MGDELDQPHACGDCIKPTALKLMNMNTRASMPTLPGFPLSLTEICRCEEHPVQDSNLFSAVVIVPVVLKLRFV